MMTTLQPVSPNTATIQTQRLNEEFHPGNIILHQPLADRVWDFPEDWATDLYDCCANKKLCFCAFCCYCFLLCELFKRTGECLCTPVFFPTALVVLRVKLRTGFGIKGTSSRDCIEGCFCGPCAAIQM